MAPRKNVRVRLAPSPTGDPHVGTAYVGLINYVFARKHQGQLVLRIEDTDQTRSSPLFEEAILESLRWFGITWDEGPDVGGPFGPYRQSERSAIYREHAETLIRTGHAYRCFCSPERLDRVRKERRRQKLNTGYDRHCLNLPRSEIDRHLAEGTPFVVRLKVPLEGETTFQDRLRGELRFKNELIDDQVLLKSDGFPTYHLANVVDDHLMGITHVIRAEEWITSTPKHVMLYNAFGWDLPEFVHVSLLRNQDRSKISKRKNPVSLVYYREAGFRPEALRNFLGLMGWNHPSGSEKFTTEEMIEAFSLDDISLGGPVFNLEKLKWLNGQYIRDLSARDLGDWLSDTLFSRHYLDRIVPLIHERMEVFQDFWKYADYFYSDDLALNPSSLIPKKRTAVQTRRMLAEVLAALENASRQGWTAEVIEQALRGYCAESEWKVREVFMTVRLAVTGKAATPPLFDTLDVLGKERVRQRLLAAQNLLKAVK